MRIESGILFCNLWVNISGNDEVMEWDKCKFGIDLNEIKSFWDMGDNNKSDIMNSTKLVTFDGDVYCVDVSFDKFSEIIIKHRNQIIIYN